MASCKQCIHKTVCAIYNDSLRETLERGGTMLCQCGEYLPAANVIEIKRGKWIDLGQSYYTVISQCSECSAKYDFRSPYCPNCGAKMEGENNV